MGFYVRDDGESRLRLYLLPYGRELDMGRDEVSFDGGITIIAKAITIK